MNIYIDTENKTLMVVSVTFAELQTIFSVLELNGYNPKEFTIEGIPDTDDQPTDTLTYYPGTGNYPIFTFTS